ncbi:MAG: hypothetical protein ACJ749_01450 [Flavisolibacter sp.]
MRNQILLVFFLLCSYAVPAQKVAASADKEKIFIGEQIQLRVFAEFNSGQPFTWFRMDTIPHFEILDSSKIDTVENAGTVTVKQTLTITSWDSGSWNFPSLVIGQMSTAPIKIEVGYSPMDPDQPYHDIKDIIAVKKPTESKWHWYFILLMVLIALFMLFFPPGKKKQKQAVFIADEGAYQKALNELNQLHEVRDDKVFYTRLVHILREYLHKRKNIQSFSKTTDDLAIQMKNLDFEHEDYGALLQTLRLSDLVKYARFNSSDDEKRNSIATMKKAITIIENPDAV